MNQQFPFEDSITIGIKSLTNHFILTILISLISFIFLIFYIFYNSFKFNFSFLYFFLPLWLSSLYGFIFPLIILKNSIISVKIITKQQRDYLLQRNQLILNEKWIDSDSILLLRYFIWNGIICSFNFLILFISEVFFIFHLFFISFIFHFIFYFKILDFVIFLVC